MEELDDNLEINNLGTKKVPNNVGILVLGICSIFPGCVCYAIPGIVCGIIALVMSSKANKLIQANPGMYDEGSKQLVKAGKICGIIGLSLSILFFLAIIAYFIIVGTIISSAAPFSRF
jgi:amino acid permease